MPDDPLAPQTPLPTPDPLIIPPSGPAAAGATSTGMEPHIAAGVAVLFSFISGIIFLVIEKRSQFVRFWAMQSTVYGLICVGLGIVLSILSHILPVFLIMTISWLLNAVVLIGAIIMLYFAFTGKEWEMTVIGQIARQQLVKFPPKP